MLKRFRSRLPRMAAGCRAALAAGVVIGGSAASAAIISVDRTGGASGNLGAHLGGAAYDGNTDNPINTNPLGLQEGVEFHADRDGQTLRSIPAFMLGADYVETFNNDKNAGFTENHAVTFNQNGVLYVMMDPRDLTLGPWLTGTASGTRFTNTGHKLIMDEGASDWIASVWSAPVLAGQTVNLGAQEGGTQYTFAASTILNPWREYLKIDIGPAGQRVEPGAQAVTGPAANTNGTAVTNVPVVSKEGDTIFVSTSAVDWRDRGDGPLQSLVQIGEDHVKNNAGMITVTLNGLPAGAYQVTSFHRDPGFTQSPAVNIFVTDAVNDGSTALGLPAVGNANTNVAVGSLDTRHVDRTGGYFTIVSDGANPVMIRFDSTGAADLETPLNGLRLLKQGLAGGLIADVTRSNGSDPNDPLIAFNLQEDSLAFNDRTHQYNDIPAYLLGAEFVQFANDDRTPTDIFHTVWLNVPAVIAHLFIDNRSPAPQWVIDEGWIDTGDDIGIDESGDGDIDNTSSVYRKLFNGGGAMGFLLRNDNGGNMYGLTIQVPEPISLGLIGMGVLAIRARRRG